MKFWSLLRILMRFLCNKLAPDEEDDRMDPASPGADFLFVSGFVKSLFAVIY